MDDNKYERVLETYRCLLSCRKKLPGMSLESAFNTEAVRDLEEEYAWLQQQYIQYKKDHPNT